jgi:hypothetical protein
MSESSYCADISTEDSLVIGPIVIQKSRVARIGETAVADHVDFYRKKNGAVGSDGGLVG